MGLENRHQTLYQIDVASCRRKGFHGAACGEVGAVEAMLDLAGLVSAPGTA